MEVLERLTSRHFSSPTASFVAQQRALLCGVLALHSLSLLISLEEKVLRGMRQPVNVD